MKHKFTLLIFFAIAFSGCFHSGVPVDPPVIPSYSADAHALWGVWRLDFDPVTETARAVPVRTSQFHVDVTPFILPPECPNCLDMVVTSFSKPDGILDLTATIKNPTTYTGLDVRAILRWETGHIWLTNPDDYTLLFDDGGLKTLNPFIAYAKDVDNREFLPMATHSREIDFRFSESGHFGEITFVVEASFPTHCNEPYEIANQSADGELIGTTPVTIQCDVFDWQEDVTGVSLDPGPLADDPIALLPDTGTLWTCTLANLKNAPAGQYNLLIRAMSPGGAVTDSIYDYVTVTVAETQSTGLDPGPWPMLGHDARHTARSPFDGPASEPNLEWDSHDEGVSWVTTYSGPGLSADGRLYVASTSGLFCLDSDGELVWDEPTPFPDVFSPPQPLLTASGLVIVCYSSLSSNSVAQGIYAYDMDNGDEVWSTTSFKYSGEFDPKGFSVYDSPVLNDDGLLVAVAREHVIIALDETTGNVQWVWPDDSSQYQSIPVGTQYEAWRGAPALAPDGSIVAVADWFENPRLIVLSNAGGQITDVPLTTLTTVNCHPIITDDSEVILGGFTFDGFEADGAVEAFSLYGTPLWNYTDDVINVLQGVAGIGPDGTLYFLDGRGGNESEFPYDYHVYLLALSLSGSFVGRWPVFSRPSAGETTITHWRNGVSVGDDGTIYVSSSFRHAALAVNYISGIAALDPDGDILWTYGEQQNVSTSQSYYGTPTIGADGTLYVTRTDRLIALK